MNIHNRFSSENKQQYYDQCMNGFLPMIIEPFRRHTETTSIVMIFAQSTLFIPYGSDKNVFECRGGHILACRLQLPPLYSRSHITVHDIISKLPGKAFTPISDAVLQDGRVLKNQEFKTEALYENSQNVLLFRDSNSSIDQSSKFAPAPVFIALIDPESVNLNFSSVFQTAQQKAKNDNEYSRMGHACGQYIVQSFQNQFTPGPPSGMSVQLGFDTTLSYIASKAPQPGLRNAVFKTLRDYGVKKDPEEMQIYGRELENQYKNQVTPPSVMEKLKFSKDMVIIETEVENPSDQVNSLFTRR